MSDEQVAPETKGVTVKLFATVDLGPEIEGMAGRQLRMRMVTIEPGGIFGPIHDHKDRPGIVYILQGTITDHRNGVATDYGPGVGWPEDRNTTHWLENRGTIPAEPPDDANGPRALGRWAVRPEGDGLLVGEGLSRFASPTGSPGARIVQVPVLVMPCSWQLSNRLTR